MFALLDINCNHTLTRVFYNLDAVDTKIQRVTKGCLTTASYTAAGANVLFHQAVALSWRATKEVAMVTVIALVTLRVWYMLPIAGDFYLQASIIYTMLLCPIIEEILFREILLGAVKGAQHLYNYCFKKAPTPRDLEIQMIARVYLVGFVFAILHDTLNVFTFVGGVTYGYAREKTGYLAAPIALHALHNSLLVAGKSLGYSNGALITAIVANKLFWYLVVTERLNKERLLGWLDRLNPLEFCPEL